MKSLIHRKFKAFTLGELIVAMILSSVVVMSGYLVYQMMNRQLTHFKENSAIYFHVHEFKNTLSSDVLDCQRMYLEKENIQLKISHDSILYVFHSEYIIRKTSLSSDTFNFKLPSVSGSFNNKNVSSGLIDCLDLTLNFAGELIGLHYFKAYDAVTLLKNSKMINE